MLKPILHITLRADYGGGPEHLFRLVSEIKKDIKCFIACPDDYPYFDKYKQLLDSDKVIVVPHRKFNVVYLFSLIRFIKKQKIQIVHSHGKGAGIYSRILKILIPHINCIHTFHGIHIGRYSNIQRKLYISLEFIFSKLTDALISVSESEKEQILKLNLCNKKKLYCINNGVVVQPLLQKENNLKFKTVSITRFDYQKNSELIIDIAQQLKEFNELEFFNFTLIGTGEEEENLKLKIDELNLLKSFCFTGTSNNPISILQNMDCYISTSRWEGLPLAVLEAMSCALPIVATKVVGHTEIIEHNSNGYLFDLNSPTQAAKYLIDLKNNIKLRKQFSNNSRKRVSEKFGVVRMAQETLAVYKELDN